MVSVEKERAQSVSIIVPAYNEEAGIGKVLKELRGVMERSGLDYEIIVVNDGSSDQTGVVASATDGVILREHKVNRGYGAALKTGIRYARHGVICITDADGTYPNDCIPELAASLEEGFDMVVGCRTGQNVAIPLIRRPAKWSIGKLANLISGESIPDINSGLRVFRKQAAVRFMSLLPDGFSFTTTITLGMLANGYAVKYVPINYYARKGLSKIKPIRDTLNFIQLILRIGLYFAPLKIFLPMSFVLLLMGIGWGGFSRFVLGRLADVSTLVVVMTAVQVGVVGLLAELINQRLPKNYEENKEP